MKRYYLSKIKMLTSPPGWSHRIAELGVDYEGGQIELDPQTGEPVHPALLALVGGIDHRQFQNDAEIVPFPQMAPDTKVSATHTATKLAFKANAKAIGFDELFIEFTVANADGWRDVLNTFGRLNNATFDVNNFDLDES